ncbi:MAG: M28 family metallopeptidase [Candidatus Goldiibacteriota bacterium]
MKGYSDQSMIGKAEKYIRFLSVSIKDRSVGSRGNIRAVDFFEKKLKKSGWSTSKKKFTALDWDTNGARAVCGGKYFKVYPAPYSNGCKIKGELVAAENMKELSGVDARGKILLLYGKIASQQLMPKNFTFYNPEDSRKTVSLLEKSRAGAIICATGRNASLAGGVYPFPLIEDGDFDISSVYMTESEGRRLLKKEGQVAEVISDSKRITSKAYNVTGVMKGQKKTKIVISAHIDAKKGSPGAIDNAAGVGVAVLLLLAESLRDSSLKESVELVAFNGEDYYSVPGQMLYIKENKGRFDKVAVNINIDGAGFKRGGSVLSFFGLPAEIKKKAKQTLRNYPFLSEGPQWPQGDHSIFVQNGRPAIAVTSKWFLDNISTQTITHTPKDNFSIVSPAKTAELAAALDFLVRRIGE